MFGMAKIGAGIIAATLTLGGGAFVATGAAGAAGAPNPARVAACQAYGSKFAQNLGVTTQQLQDARAKTANQIIDEKLAAGTITADQAQRARARVASGPGVCEQIAGGGQRAAALREIGKVELTAVAQKLGITERQLVAEVRGGKSLAQVAQARNVGRDDLKATMRTALKTELDTRVAAGKITADQATKALAAFDARVDTLIDRVGGKR